MKNKKEAADYLGVSTRAIERYVSEGKLVPQYRMGRRGREAVYTDADLDAVKHDRETPTAEVMKPTQALVRRPSSGVVARHIRPVSDPSGPRVEDLTRMVCLTIEQAAQLAGLGVGTIERAIHDGQLVAQPVGPRGARVVLREHVETFARSLFDPKPTKRRR